MLLDKVAQSIMKCYVQCNVFFSRVFLRGQLGSDVKTKFIIQHAVEKLFLPLLRTCAITFSKSFVSCHSWQYLRV